MLVKKIHPTRPLNVRSNGSMKGKVKGQIIDTEPHEVVQEKNGWGRLENGGWIKLEFVEEVADDNSEGAGDDSTDDKPDTADDNSEGAGDGE